MGVVLPCACDRIAGFPTDGQGAGSHRLTMPSPRVAVVVSYTETCSRPGGHTQTAYFLFESTPAGRGQRVSRGRM